MDTLPRVTRVRHDTTRRRLTVARVERLAPKITRVVLGGDDLRGFTSLGFDDHVKLFFPTGPGGADPGGPAEPAMRDFTPRRFEAAAGELWIDFYLHVAGPGPHEAGPAAAWAAQAAPGQHLDVGGPRGSSVISLEGIDSHVLVGDETALPAIGRRLEELPPHARAIVVLDTEAGADGYPLATRAQVDVVRVPTGAPASRGERIIGTLRTLPNLEGSCFTWIAAESHVARAIRRHLMSERGIDKRWIKAAGYWRHGTVGTHETITED